MEKNQKLLVCGAGIMGCEIAQVFAEMGDSEVIVYDIKPMDVQEALPAAVSQLRYGRNTTDRQYPQLCTAISGGQT